jgi:hypothetical protein
VERIKWNRYVAYLTTQYDNLLQTKDCSGCYENFRKANHLLCASCRFRGIKYRVGLLKTGYNIYDNDEVFEKHLTKRQQIIDAHNKGKLSKSWYRYKPNGQRYLSPDKLRAEGF